MKETRTNPIPTEIPKDIRRLIPEADIDGSACFLEASVYFIDKGHRNDRAAESSKKKPR
ncbi:MAG: hypothetical protein ACLUFV_01340 [Acutalibacteraceae bacterium]